MKNFVQPGENITIAAPADVVSGQGVLVGDLFGVASGAALSGETVVIATVGVYELPKALTDVISVGTEVFWDGTAVALTDGSGANVRIGHATQAAANPSSVCRVRLSV